VGKADITGFLLSAWTSGSKRTPRDSDRRVADMIAPARQHHARRFWVTPPGENRGAAGAFLSLTMGASDRGAGCEAGTRGPSPNAAPGWRGRRFSRWLKSAPTTRRRLPSDEARTVPTHREHGATRSVRSSRPEGGWVRPARPSRLRAFSLQALSDRADAGGLCGLVTSPTQPGNVVIGPVSAPFLKGPTDGEKHTVVDED
jgi:hypothetical protein